MINYKNILAFIILLLAMAILLATAIYKISFQPNKALIKDNNITISIYEQKYITNILNDSSYLKNKIAHPKALLLTAKIKRFNGQIAPGKYTIEPSMSNNDIINIFRSRIQKPIIVTFNNLRTQNELAGRLSQQLMLDSVSILNVFSNTTLLKNYGLNTNTAHCIFLPDSYEMYWTISAEDLYKRMYAEYNKFWNKERIQKATQLDLSKEEIITLASIVNEESNRKKEQPIIAGLYINRLKRGILLQADPTLKFAINDFEKKRILNVDKKIDSPYNTYMYKGLPPGPIRIPTKSAIDAVLNYKSHKYLYMCAKADLSGNHHFSETLREHNKYAREYQRQLNRMRIYK